jgi:hypothetical protein
MRIRHAAALAGALLLAAGGAQAGTVFGTSGYYAVLEFRVTGNSPFFDPFEDGSLTQQPTSYFTPLGGTVLSEPYSIGGLGRPEYEGQLALTAADGAADEFFGGASDVVFEGIPLVNDEGNATIDATFLFGFPEPGELFGIGTSESDTYLPTNLLFVVTTGDDVSGLPAPCAVPHAGVIEYYTADFELACDVVDIGSVSGAFVLRFAIDDATNTALPSYSVDGGMMFVGAAGWDVPAVAGDVWTYSFFVFPSVFAAYQLPEPGSDGATAAALACVALLALRRGRS